MSLCLFPSAISRRLTLLFHVSRSVSKFKRIRVKRNHHISSEIHFVRLLRSSRRAVNGRDPTQLNVCSVACCICSAEMSMSLFYSVRVLVTVFSLLYFISKGPAVASGMFLYYIVAWCNCDALLFEEQKTKRGYDNPRVRRHRVHIHKRGDRQSSLLTVACFTDGFCIRASVFVCQ